MIDENFICLLTYFVLFQYMNLACNTISMLFFAIIVMQVINARLETCIFKMCTNQTFVKKFKNSINIYAYVIKIYDNHE